MRRPKTGQKPRGVLLVPTLRDPARDVETADAARGDEPSLGPAEPEQRVPEEQVLERSVPEQPVLEQPVLEQPVLEQPVLEEPVDAVDAAVEPIARTAAPDEEPTEERGGIVPAGDRPPLDVAAMLRRFEDRTTASLPPSVRRFGRPVGFAVLLVGLALAGLLVGRLLRDSGDSPSVVAPTVTSSTAQPKQPAPASARKPASDRWGPLRAMPAGRLAQPAARAAAVRVGDRVVVLGGTTGDAVQIGKAGGVLRSAASLPGVRAGPAAFVSGGAVYLIGGEAPDAAPSDAIVRFDPGTSQVTSAGSFVEPLAGAGYVQGRDSLFLVGGWTGTQYATAVLRFTLPDTASVVARLPVATRDMAVAVRGDTLYAAGGRTADGLNDAVYAVDLSEGTVETVGRLPEAVWGASLVVAGGQLYLLGGKNKAGDAVRSIVRIDPASGRIERAGTMPKPLAGAAAVRVGDATYLLGGTRPNSVIRLTPAG